MLNISHDNLYLTITNDPEATQNNHKYVLEYDPWGYYLFSSNSKKAFKRFIKKMGLTILNCVYCSEDCKVYKIKQNYTRIGFTDKKQLPKKAKKIKALSNGSIVNCYYTNDGDTLTFYRPNPNCKKIYKPLSIKAHIKYQKINGIF